jgi:putative DNA primase/helicase
MSASDRLGQIPAELRERPQWVCWRSEQRDRTPTKVPVDARNGRLASITRPTTWSSFDDALKAVRRFGCDGVGFVFTRDDPFAGVDLDHCLDDDRALAPAAREIVDAFATYTEVSPSGNGVHCILRGTLPLGARKKASLEGQPIEVYSEGRFFCMTGAAITEGTPISDRQPELEELCERLKAAARAHDSDGAKLREGEGRNNELTRRLGLEVAKGVTGAELARRACELNDFDPPLDDAEVEKILRSAGQWPIGKVPVPARHRTDSGNGERLIGAFGDRVRFCHEHDGWHIYDGIRWAPDKKLEIEHLAGEALRGIFLEAFEATDKDERDALAKWAIASEAAAKRRATVELARSDPRVAVRADVFDHGPWLLNCSNGTIDLHTGELRPHDSRNLITKIVPVAHDPNAKSELWQRVLEEATGGDVDLERYLQRAFGYGLTGSTAEEVFFVFLGGTETGKSTITNAVRQTLGNYADDIKVDTFLRQEIGRTRGDLLRLEGVRLGILAEAVRGTRMDEGLLKAFVSAEPLTVRKLYHDERTFTPLTKLFMHTNYMPRMSEDDDAIWRRARILPFSHRPQRIDKSMKLTLCNPAVSGAAILAWLVEGCLAWQREGLGSCEAVERATAVLRDEMDLLAGFWTECCIFVADAWTPSADLLAARDRWARENGLDVRALPKGKTWGACLQRKHCRADQKTVAKQTMRGWRGVRLVGADVSQTLGFEGDES